MIFIFILCSVEDWDIFEKVMDYTYNRRIKSESCLHPLLMSEPAVSMFFVSEKIIDLFALRDLMMASIELLNMFFD